MKRRWSMVCSVIVSGSIFGVIALFISTAGTQYSKKIKEQSSAMLEAYRSNVNGVLEYEYNHAARLRDILYASEYNYQYLGECAQSMLSEGIEYIAVTDKAYVRTVYSRDGDLQGGQKIEELDYCYQLARLNAAPVREGPVDDVLCNKKVFIIIEPIFENRMWIGQIAVAVQAEMIYKSFKFDSLRESGYDYLFWRIHPLNGQKENLITSDANVDYSSAREIRFEMPTVYTLSILPKGGWSVSYNYTSKLLYAGLIALLYGLSLFFTLQYIYLRKELYSSSLLDSETKLLNREGLLHALEKEINQNEISVIYCMLYNLSNLLISASSEERLSYIDFIVRVFNEYVQSPHITARITSDSFIIAIKKPLALQELEDISKGLAIELFRKVKTGQANSFPIIRFGYAVSSAQEKSVNELVDQAIDDYEKRRKSLSPIVDLKNVCDAMISGETDLSRKEYDDNEINELAKSLFRYYRKTRKNQ